MMKVEGKGNVAVYSGKQVDEVYLGDESVASSISATPKASTEPTAVDGKALFLANCAMCHQAEGQGVPGAFPPLAKSDYLKRIATEKRGELVELVLRGKTGKITVNGVEYNGVMTPVAGLDDGKLSAVLNYVSNTWGNQAKAFTVEEVKKLREALAPVAAPIGGH
jgi:nitrite reductase (NO-forming)